MFLLNHREKLLVLVVTTICTICPQVRTAAWLRHSCATPPHICRGGRTYIFTMCGRSYTLFTRISCTLVLISVGVSHDSNQSLSELSIAEYDQKNGISSTYPLSPINLIDIGYRSTKHHGSSSSDAVVLWHGIEHPKTSRHHYFHRPKNHFHHV